MYLDKAKMLLAERHIVPDDKIIPCSAKEVTDLERLLGLYLPDAYKEFMLWMGHGAGILFEGEDCFYGFLPNLRTWATNLLMENRFPVALPSEAFVFCMRQGYVFDFMCIGEGQDPPVYTYNEASDQTTFLMIQERFSDYVFKEIEFHSNRLPKKT